MTLFYFNYFTLYNGTENRPCSSYGAATVTVNVLTHVVLPVSVVVTIIVSEAVGGIV